MDAERDKREVRKLWYFERYSPVILRILMYGELDKIEPWQDIISKLASYFVPKQNSPT